MKLFLLYGFPMKIQLFSVNLWTNTLVLHIFTESDGSPEASDHEVVVEESKPGKVEPVSEGE